MVNISSQKRKEKRKLEKRRKQLREAQRRRREKINKNQNLKAKQKLNAQKYMANYRQKKRDNNQYDSQVMQEFNKYYPTNLAVLY
jgi:predicted HTH transcriptional regulator